MVKFHRRSERKRKDQSSRCSFRASRLGLSTCFEQEFPLGRYKWTNDFTTFRFLPDRPLLRHSPEQCTRIISGPFFTTIPRDPSRLRARTGREESKATTPTTSLLARLARIIFNWGILELFFEARVEALAFNKGKIRRARYGACIWVQRDIQC